MSVPDPGRGRIAVCPSRFADGVGGAEIVQRQLAHRLAARGWEVDVLTSTATDHFGFRNDLAPGVSREGDVTVHRFPVVQDTSGGERSRLHGALLSGVPLTLDEQETWLEDQPRVPGVFHHLLTCGEGYRAVLGGPYGAWTTTAMASAAPDRSVLWTCFHDEPEASLPLYEPLFCGVAGLLLQTDPERDLLEAAWPGASPHDVVGCGVEVPARYDVERFRRETGVEGRFVLYMGRREGGKGWPDLVRAFGAALDRHDLPFTLVAVGAGPMDVPHWLEDRVVDLGFQPDDMRDAAYAAADAYVQPGALEAFSRTIMESWLAGTPVLANRASQPVRWHCERSGAGLLWGDDLELGECLAFVAAEPEEAARLAEPGREYVLSQYTWEHVLDAVEASLDTWLPR